ncbi:MAG TPA: vanadium-dependent haloperoxidase [Prolixibacteraceae bacterium]|nr:vanadium-dependent haloperoxidase [Prolixibacteraceae bacterium]
MKKQLKLFGYTLGVCLAMIACEIKDMEHVSEIDAEKFINNGIIKSYNNAMVLTWNEALSVAVDNQMPPAVEARTYAMVTLAVHDALNNVIPKYETYALDNSGVNAKEVSRKNIYSIANAAVAQAAHDALVALVPASAADAGTLLTSSLVEIEESEFKALGIKIGKEAALSVLDVRKNDPTLRFHEYPQGTEPGQFQSPMPYAVANPPVWPANSAYAPDLGSFRPFGIESSSQFRVKPPYLLDSPKYTADYNEVKILGSNTSTERTAEQADMGMFFLDNVSNLTNRIARIMAVQEKLDGWETARLMAVTQMTQFDALLSSFEAMYHYNRWRPVTAIKYGDTDGNDDTTGDPTWSILQTGRPTPPTPTYPSTHAEMGSAGAEIFKLFFKKDNKPFTIGSYSLPAKERSFSSFSQFATECSLSRIYVGYQFRNDLVEGEKMGRVLAEFVYTNNLRELK